MHVRMIPALGNSSWCCALAFEKKSVNGQHVSQWDSFSCIICKCCITLQILHTHPSRYYKPFQFGMQTKAEESAITTCWVAPRRHHITLNAFSDQNNVELIAINQNIRQIVHSWSHSTACQSIHPTYVPRHLKALKNSTLFIITYNLNKKSAGRR